MGAEEAFTKPQFLTSSSPTTTSSTGSPSSSSSSANGVSGGQADQVNTAPTPPQQQKPNNGGSDGGKSPITSGVQLKQLKSHFEHVAKINGDSPKKKNVDRVNTNSVVISEGAKSVSRIFSSIASGGRGYVSGGASVVGGIAVGCGSCLGGCGGGETDVDATLENSIVALISGLTQPPPQIPPLPPELRKLTSNLDNNSNKNGDSNVSVSAMGTSVNEGEWHQKYAFILGLLRKPHVILVKESLARERDKLVNKLSAYRLERNIVRESVNKFIQNGSETSAQQSLTAQIKHLDMMCVTLERQIDVLSHVDHALPATENIYSGEPDSLDGTSSEIMPHDDDDDDDDLDRHLSGASGALHSSAASNNNNHMSHVGQNNHHRSGFGGGGTGPGFQLQINGRSPLDALAMLHLERCAHRETRKELNQLRKKYELLRDEFDSGEGLSQSTSLLFSRLNGDQQLEEEEMMFSGDDPGAENSIGTDESNSRLVEEVRLKESTISQLRNRLLLLEKARMDKVPVDVAREISRLHSALVQLERVRDELTLQNFTLKSKLAELSARISDSATYRLEKPLQNGSPGNPVNKTHIDHLKTNSGSPTVVLTSRSPHLTHGGHSHQHPHPPPSSLSPTSGGAPGSANFSDEGVGGVNSTSGASTTTTVTPGLPDDLRLRRKSTYKISHNIETNGEIKQLRSLINDLHAKELDYQRKLGSCETELRNVKNQYADECASRAEGERIVRELEAQLDITQRRLEEAERTFLTKEEECSAYKLDVDTLNEENRRLKDDLNLLHLKVEKEQTRSIEKLTKFEKELGCILDANRSLQDDCQRERILRKKYYNMMEELKGKIRVFCRIRPASKSERMNNEIVAKCSDPYTIALESAKGRKEFQFDRVFTPDESQDEVFADTKNLIQSAFDGYNVCICAYGQTGSGKTYTILGDDGHPGIAPRTFSEVFKLADEMSQTYETSVSFYVLELYNDRLIDLLNNGAGGGGGGGNSTSSNSSIMDQDKLEIRRDRRGTVWVSGARVLPAEDSSSLEKSFRLALQARHTASTRMNDRSSRSHLIVGLIIETTSKVNGTVLRGKISLVDLAGSERTGKSGVSADTLREANAINKSLSAFGDVINALTTDQAFVPYRNNKLTLLMQDSIGGNAKTLMFVNVSPSSYNVEETLVSLSYGQRLKQVTNGATRNAESREVARLKSIIQRLKRGEIPSDADDIYM